jgi:N-acetyl-anhydromuramyl-L-alanine amidase AmpD
MIAAIYPTVQMIHDPSSSLQKPFGPTGPLGITIHYAADRDVNRMAASLKEQKLKYHLVIDRKAAVIQTAYLTHAVNHAGNAMWNGQSPNRQHLAVCIMSWGYLEKFENSFIAWNGQKIPSEDVKYRPDNHDGKLYHWDAATPAQEKRLIEICKYFIALGIKVENICGHDEAALPSGRKSDPGGVLSVSMNDFRKNLVGSYGLGTRNT